MDQTFSPMGRISGRLTVPADKSIAHRAFLLAAMAGGSSRIAGRIAGEDVSSTMRCVEVLGAGIERRGPGQYSVAGTGWSIPDEASLDCGNSGTTMRLLAGALAGRPGSFLLTGDASLSRRPMERVAEPLRRMGAAVDTSAAGRPPIRVTGARLHPISYAGPVASAQVKSAILLAGLQAEGTTTVEEPEPSRDHTERMLAWLGCQVGVEGRSVAVTGGEELFRHPGFVMKVPGDLSSAAFWIVAAVLAPKGRVTVEGAGLNPGRTGVLEILAAMGADLQVDRFADQPEPFGSVTAAAGSLQATEIGGPLIPRTVDELPLIALAATQAEGVTVIRDAAELRVKETDRIAVLAAGLRTMGAKVEDRPDGLVIEGPTPLHGGVVDAAGDHRMALTFAVAGLIGRDSVTVRGWEAANVSYPQFLDDLAEVAG
ncbi:MAG TPA: 3-phosphoshikimate 1-carboxyvinyltransferase [Actinomycetota bacterium]|nr:3-phosphoshikimate 1-carboxyvinyltransferase [Actinomycetota bacterium]